MLMKKIAVILAGCGHMDGAEIRESVLTLLAIDKMQASAHIFAPDIIQHDTINHLTGAPTQETRNVLVEAARIARGQIQDITLCDATNFDALIMPGGFGAVKNLSDLASMHGQAEVIAPLKSLIAQFISQAKPIGAICIAPAVIACALKHTTLLTLTLGEHHELLSEFGAKEELCKANECVIDIPHKIVSTPAYMLNARLAEIAEGIESLVKEVLNLCV